jgi:hypothetical protein
MDDVVAHKTSRVNNLVYTSVEDLKSSLEHCTISDLDVLQEALTIAGSHEMKTKAMLIRRKIWKLEKQEVENG